MKQQLILPLLVAIVIASTGCASSRLAEYDFDDTTVSVVVNSPAAPYVRTGDTVILDPDNLIASAVRTGAAIAREVSADRVQERMLRAMREVDVASRVADRTLERSAAYLRARPVEDSDAADYLLDIWIHDYGIHTSSWDSEVFFRMKADVILLDGETGRRIWKQRIKVRDPITSPSWIDTAVDDILTADALSRLSKSDLANAFERLADATADRFARELREDLRKARK